MAAKDAKIVVVRRNGEVRCRTVVLGRPRLLPQQSPTPVTSLSSPDLQGVTGKSLPPAFGRESRNLAAGGDVDSSLLQLAAAAFLIGEVAPRRRTQWRVKRLPVLSGVVERRVRGVDVCAHGDSRERNRPMLF